MTNLLSLADLVCRRGCRSRQPPASKPGCTTTAHEVPDGCCNQSSDHKQPEPVRSASRVCGGGCGRLGGSRCGWGCGRLREGLARDHEPQKCACLCRFQHCFLPCGST